MTSPPKLNARSYRSGEVDGVIRWPQLPESRIRNRDLSLVLFKLPIDPRLSLGTFVGNVMDGQPNIGTAACPPTEESVLAEARQVFEELVCFCLGEERTFWEFEKRLLVLCSAWAVC